MEIPLPHICNSISHGCRPHSHTFLVLKVDFDVQWLLVLPSLTAGSVSMVVDSQHFIVLCCVHCQMHIKGYPRDGAKCLAVQGASMVSLSALCYAPWAFSLANVLGPGVHCSTIKDGYRKLLGYQGPFGKVRKSFISLITFFTCIKCYVPWEKKKERKYQCMSPETSNPTCTFIPGQCETRTRI